MTLSLPLSELEDHYDVVIVGSGYGGAVAARYLARCDVRVCVLEKGREYQPGDFPRDAAEVLAETTPGGEPMQGARLFELLGGADMTALVGSGLGGGSLINAGVAIWPDAHVFEHEAWGSVDLEELTHARDEVFADLQAVEAPAAVADLPKTRAFAALGEAEAVPASIRYGDDKQACTLCGDCVTGCNQGAKRTLVDTHLRGAAASGVQLFTEVAVDHVRRVEEGSGRWEVVLRPVRLDGVEVPTLSVRAHHVILAAGAIGSPEILHRSGQAGLSVSEDLGQGFTGNGDELLMLYNGRDRVHTIGYGRKTLGQSGPVGPTITSELRLGDERIQVGAIPGALGPLMAFSLRAAAKRRYTDARLEREVTSWVQGFRKGATAHTQVLLRMYEDPREYALELGTDGRVWGISRVGGEDEAAGRRSEALESLAARFGAELIRSNDFLAPIGVANLTVHPLGGCGIGRVVDDEGRVLDRTGEVQEGLRVLDGSIVPTPLGANPLLTIGALALRAMKKEADWKPGPEPKARPEAPPRPTLSFSERMYGAVEDGDLAGRSVSMFLRLSGLWRPREQLGPFDVQGVLQLEGEGAPPRRYRVKKGEVFGGIKEGADLQRLGWPVMAPPLGGLRPDALAWLTYELECEPVDDPTGVSLTVSGAKPMYRQAPPIASNLLADLMSMQVELREGGERLGRAALRLDLDDLMAQLRSARFFGHGPDVQRDLVEAALEVLRFVYPSYEPRARPKAPAPTGPVDTEPTPPRSDDRQFCRTPPDAGWASPTSRLQVFRARRGPFLGPLVLAPGFGVSTRSYHPRSGGETLVEHLVARGYDVWLFDYRASPEVAGAREPFRLRDIAAEDWPQALAFVRNKYEGPVELGVLAHCVGALTFMWASMICDPDAPWADYALCSQVGLFLPTDALNEAKAQLGVWDLLRDLTSKQESPRFDILQSILQAREFPQVLEWLVPFQALRGFVGEYLSSGKGEVEGLIQSLQLPDPLEANLLLWLRLFTAAGGDPLPAEVDKLLDPILRPLDPAAKKLLGMLLTVRGPSPLFSLLDNEERLLLAQVLPNYYAELTDGMSEEDKQKVNPAYFDVRGELPLDRILERLPFVDGRRNSDFVIRRIFALFGQSFKIDNLDQDMLEEVSRMFGAANLRGLEDVGRVIARDYLEVFDGPEPARALLERFDFPLTLFSGTENREFYPEGTEDTLNLLRYVEGAPGRSRFARETIEGYAHMDCFVGKDAARDVFGRIAGWLDDLRAKVGAP